MQENQKISWVQFGWRVSACHIVTYFIAGVLAFYLLNYRQAYLTTMLSAFMRPTDSLWVAAGPSLQIIRGILFGFVLWPVKDFFLKANRGWVKLWLIFLGLAVLGTAGPTPGSIEGLIYTKLPLAYHLLGLPEVIFQTLLFSLVLFYWYQKPARKWDVFMGIGIVFIILMSIAGMFFGK
jgi:VanZ family protein